MSSYHKSNSSANKYYLLDPNVVECHTINKCVVLFHQLLFFTTICCSISKIVGLWSGGK